MIHLMNVKRGAPLKRGHQHHVRFTGNRNSTVDAEQILAVLRAGDHMPIEVSATDAMTFDNDSQMQDVEIVNDTMQSVHMVGSKSFYLIDNGNNISAFIFQIGNDSTTNPKYTFECHERLL